MNPLASILDIYFVDPNEGDATPPGCRTLSFLSRLRGGNESIASQQQYGLRIASAWPLSRLFWRIAMLKIAIALMLCLSLVGCM